MKNEELLKAMGNIDDDLIQAAEERRDSKDLKILRTAPETKAKPNYRKYIAGFVGIAAAIAIFIGAGSMLRMGGMAKTASQDVASDEAYYYSGFNAAKGAAPMEMAEMPEMEYVTNATVEDYKLKAEADMGASGVMTEEGVFEPYEPVQVQKLTYRAYMNLQTTDFEGSVEKLKAMVEEYGGYIENSDSYNGSYYETNAFRNGYFTLRIPTERYKEFVSAVGEDMYLCSINESVDDITEQYYDTAERLESLRIKEARLQELLAQAGDMSDIIQIESALTDVQYQIESYESSLKRYDKQVDYSTITIDLNEVSQYRDGVKRESLPTRIVRAIKNGIINVGESLEAFVIWIGYNLIPLAIIIILLVLIKNFHVVRRIINYIKNL